MKILFWYEVFISIFCFSSMIYDFAVGEYALALIQAFCTLVDVTIAILAGIEVYWK